MINKMKDEDLLVPLDYSKIEGIENIGPEFLNQSFDPGNKFSIPYFWGTLGIVYNETMVDEAPEHWDDLWKPEYKDSIMLFDGAREVLGLGLNSLGYSQMCIRDRSQVGWIANPLLVEDILLVEVLAFVWLTKSTFWKKSS